MAIKPTLAPFSLLLSPLLFAQSPPVLPVREVTVFKDGHAYVVREMPLPADANGTVVLDELPAPVLGTFWPFASDGASLVSARAGRERVATDLRAIDLRQIVRANVGKDVVVVTHGERIEGRLLAVPEREAPKKKPEPQAAAGYYPYPTPAPGPSLLLVQTASGTRALPIENVRDIEVHGEFAANVREQVDRERLTLTVAGGGANAKVGVMYVQKGLRWVPSYRLDVDGAGKVAVQFEATLVNDLVDLERATVHLVVGVPKFEFEGMLDPISLQDEIAQVAASSRHTEHRNVLANSLRTQSGGFAGGEGQQEPPVADGGATEDLFVFTLTDVTLKQGERLVMPVRTFEIAYRDVYKLEVPFAPPADVRQGLQSERVIELARQLAAPKARHVLRLQNTADVPLTTAPALVLARGRVLAQARLTYTPKGREVDVEINTAIDIRVESEEHEVKRDPGPVRLGSENYGRVDVAGTIVLWNGKAQPVAIEVSRRVLGLCDAVGQGGSNRQLDLVQAWYGAAQPAWWGWWSWPHWWFVHNGFGEYRWQVELAPGATTKLDATWHYFWR